MSKKIKLPIVDASKHSINEVFGIPNDRLAELTPKVGGLMNSGMESPAHLMSAVVDLCETNTEALMYMYILGKNNI